MIQDVVPFECHASNVGAIDFFRDFVMFLEGLAKMIQVGIADILSGKVVNNECKHDRVPLVTPKTGGGGYLVVVQFGKAVLEEVVCKNACLGETVHATAHFEVDPEIAGKHVELVFVNEFLGDVSKLDMDILWLGERGINSLSAKSVLAGEKLIATCSISR